MLLPPIWTSITVFYILIVILIYPATTLLIGLIKTYGIIDLKSHPRCTLACLFTFIPVHLVVFIFGLNNIGAVRKYLTRRYFDTEYEFPIFDILGKIVKEEYVSIIFPLTQKTNFLFLIF